MKGLVMIVDDHAVIRRMVRALFEDEDLEVSDAANGAEGVQKARELKPNLIILDLSMPVMNGLDAARALNLLMPHVPLLMFTNNAGGVLEKESRSAGIAAVISTRKLGFVKYNGELEIHSSLLNVVLHEPPERAA